MIDKEERNKKTFAIILVIAVLFLGIYKIFFDKGKNIDEVIDTQTISVVEDNSRFFTVSSCVAKYLNNLYAKDTEKLLLLLSNNYKKSNSIDENNLYDYIGTLQGNTTFSPKKMFVQRMSKSIYKYYVYGYTSVEIMDTMPERKDYYLIVVLNEKEMTFEVEPYSGDLFK